MSFPFEDKTKIAAPEHTKKESKQRLGRQREFDETEALDQAMKVFWMNGFIGTSLKDLTEAMGINKPSLYAAFGNKEQLFVSATNHYLQQYAASHLKYLADDFQPFNIRFIRYLESIAKLQTEPNMPKGCFLSLCTGEAAGETMPPIASSAIEKAKIQNETYLLNVFSAAKKNKEVSDLISDEDFMLFTLTLLHGMAVMARSGKSFSQMKRVIATAVTALAI